MRPPRHDITPTTWQERILDALSHLPGELGYIAFRKLKRRLQVKAELRFQHEVKALSETDVVLDFGANVGDLTALFEKQGCEIHAFEPEPDTFKLLEMRYAKSPKINLYKAAVGVTDGWAELVVPSSFLEKPRSASKASSITLDRYKSPDAITHKVQVINAIDFIKGLRRPPKLIKMDIEGAELEILEKMTVEAVLPPDTMVFVETHERLDRSHLKRVRSLQSWAKTDAGPYFNLFWG
jgi:FkbM family methyltransferase